jgi:trk system potassium uptake protein TrkH
MTQVLLTSGPELVGAYSAVNACSNHGGPGTNDASLNDFQTWTLAPVMLPGRLELIPVFVLFTRAFWRG